MMSLASFVMSVVLLFTMPEVPTASTNRDVGPLVRSVWLVQSYGTSEAADPRNDLRTKGALSKALGKTNILTLAGVNGLMDPSTFARLAASKEGLDENGVRQIIEANPPASRAQLLPKVAEYADYLTTTFDLIDEPHLAAGEKLAGWIAQNYRPGELLHVTFICTGNSRRSILGATMGNIAAAYYGMPEIRFHSGGTAPSAFNTRTVDALREVGLEIESTGNEAPRGDPATANPIYHVRWGEQSQKNNSPLETTEFSKLYADQINPQN